MSKKLIKINILTPAKFLRFRNLEPFSASGLLCECKYQDGTKEYLPQPYIIVPEFKESGNYQVKIYKDKKATTEEPLLFTTYQVEYINSKDSKLKENKEIVTDYTIKKGYFEIENNSSLSLFIYKKYKKENVIPIYIAKKYNDDYKKFMEEWGDEFDDDVIDEVIEEAKKKNINIVFKEVK